MHEAHTSPDRTTDLLAGVIDDCPDYGYEGITNEGDGTVDVSDDLPPELTPRGDSFGPYEGVDPGQARQLPQILADIHVPPEERTAMPGPGGQYRLEGENREEISERLRRLGFVPLEKLSTFIDAQRSLRRGFTGETGPTPQERAMLRRLYDAYCRIGEDLGVDLESRLPKLEHLHFFDKPEDYAEAIRRGCGEEPIPWEGGRSHILGGIYLRRDNLASVKSALAHELGHEISLRRAKLEPLGDGRVRIRHLTSGYFPVSHRLGGGGMVCPLSELTVEMFMNKALGAGDDTDRHFAYGPLDLLGTAIVRKTADFHGLPPHEVESWLLKGSVNGDMTGLSLMVEALGEERAVRFLGMDPGKHSLVVGAAMVAAELGVSEAIDGLARGIHARPPFDWYRPAVRDARRVYA